MKFIAIANTPGYLPDSEPVEFDNAQDAWAYLADERERWENEASDGCNDEVCDPGCPWRAEAELSETFSELSYLAVNVDQWGTLGSNADAQGLGTVDGDTPGYHGDHDLGVCYSVEVAED